MSDTANKRSASLDPTSRISEILFGLIMVLTFTSTMRAADLGREDVREMLWGALGCNLAWGIIDAFMYLINIAAERGREDLLLSKLKKTETPAAAHELLRENLPDAFSNALSGSELDVLRANLIKTEHLKSKSLITFADLWAAFIVFALVFLTIFPVAIPFMFIQEPGTALRISNLIALTLLFGLGATLAQYAGRSPWSWGLKMVAIGVFLVAVANYFGG